MKLTELLKAAAERLEKENVIYALAGGLAVSSYRLQERTTKDVDFIIGEKEQGAKLAKSIIESFGLRGFMARRADLDGGPLFARKNKSTPICVVVGRHPKDQQEVGLDFLLSEIPWVESAVERAQHNHIDYGFKKIPTITVEDAIIAKLEAVKDGPRVTKGAIDMDDIRSMLEAGHELDLTYLSGQIRAFELPIPKELKHLFPKPLLQAAKAARYKP